MTYTKDNINILPIPSNPRFMDHTKHVFTKLTVLGYAGPDPYNRSQWFCECACGAVIRTLGTELRAQHTRSCGCLRKYRTIEGYNTPEQRAWRNMLRRCENPDASNYCRYGGRGILVCQGWHDVANFVRDIGQRPSAKYSLDRIENNKHYTCGKCKECTQNQWVLNGRWATALIQNNNKRDNHYITYQDRTQSAAMWARELHLPYRRLLYYVKQGRSLEFVIARYI